jgi:hypothetical protein
MATLVSGALVMPNASATGVLSSRDGQAQSITVTVTGSGLTGSVHGPRYLHPGPVSLKIADETRSSGAHQPPPGAAVTVVAMQRGYHVSRLLKDIAAQTGNNPAPAVAAASTRDINKIAVAYGGGDKTRGLPSFRSSNVFLNHPGTYYVINTSGSKPVVLGTLFLVGPRVHQNYGQYRGIQGVVNLGNARGRDVITASRLPAHGTIEVRNLGGGVHLMQMMKLASSKTTDAQIQAEFDAFMAGRQPSSDPAGFNSAPTASTGTDAISTGHSALLRYNLPHGTYLILCFIADDQTGVPHAFMGMHLVVHI